MWKFYKVEDEENFLEKNGLFISVHSTALLVSRAFMIK